MKHFSQNPSLNYINYINYINHPKAIAFPLVFSQQLSPPPRAQMHFFALSYASSRLNCDVFYNKKFAFAFISANRIAFDVLSAFFISAFLSVKELLRQEITKKKVIHILT